MDDLSKDIRRLRNITATEMSTLFGLNKYQTPRTLLEQKLNPQPIINNHVRRGKLREPSVLEAFALDLGWKTVRHEDGTLELPDFRIAATPDAYLADGSAVVEAKSIMSKNFDKWYESVPLNYHVQVHTQLLVTGKHIGYIGALEEGDPAECEYRFIVWSISRDAELEKLMVQETKKFWDSVAEDKPFRVDSKVKKQASEILARTSKLVLPTEIPKRIVKTDEEKLSDIVALFE